MDMKICYPNSHQFCRTNRMGRNLDNFLVIPSFFNSNRLDFDDFLSTLQPYNCARKCENNFVKKFQLGDFEPCDIELKLSSDKRKLQIDAKKEKKFEKNGFRSYSIKEFSQTIDLPENLDIDKLKSVMNENNELVITAPKLLSITEKKKETELEIKLDSSKLNENNEEQKNDDKIEAS